MGQRLYRIIALSVIALGLGFAGQALGRAEPNSLPSSDAGAVRATPFVRPAPSGAAPSTLLAQGEQEGELHEVIVRRHPGLRGVASKGLLCAGDDIAAFQVFGVDRKGNPVATKVDQINIPKYGKLQKIPREKLDSFIYFSQRWDGKGSEELQFTLKGEKFGVLKTVSLDISLRWCLDGVWQDGNRNLEITQTGDQVKAKLKSGTICDQTEKDLIFSGGITGNKLNIENLMACEPAECLNEGEKKEPYYVRWDAEISEDGKYIDGIWKRKMFEHKRKDGRNICTDAGYDQDRLLTISRCVDMTEYGEAGEVSGEVLECKSRAEELADELMEFIDNE